MKKSKYWCSLTLLALFSCQSPPPPEGLLKKTSLFGNIAFWPASEAFWPSFKDENSIDDTLLKGDHLLSILEERILISFQNQPQVHGMIPDNTQKLISQNSSLKSILAFLHQQKDLFTKSSKNMSGECLSSQNIPSYYQHCLLNKGEWKIKLPQLMTGLAHSDALLIVQLTQAQKKHENQKLGISVGVLVTLISGVEGNMIWIREGQETIWADLGQPYPPWSWALDKLFSPSFWQGFPGRTS